MSKLAQYKSRSLMAIQANKDKVRTVVDTVEIIGGAAAGAAGAVVARIATERGHAVTLYEKSAELGNNYGFHQELVPDGSFGRSHRFADAYFEGSFSNRNQHDVHQADGSAQEGDQADEFGFGDVLMLKHPVSCTHCIYKVHTNLRQSF